MYFRVIKQLQISMFSYIFSKLKINHGSQMILNVFVFLSWSHCDLIILQPWSWSLSWVLVLIPVSTKIQFLSLFSQIAWTSLVLFLFQNLFLNLFSSQSHPGLGELAGVNICNNSLTHCTVHCVNKLLGIETWKSLKSGVKLGF